MRGENCVGPTTRPEVVTEGMLTRQLQRDPKLSGVSLVILGVFYDSSLQADLALPLDVQQGLREDLKILLMLATLDNAPLIVSESYSFPVPRRFTSLSATLRFEEAVRLSAAISTRRGGDRTNPARARIPRGGRCRSHAALRRSTSAILPALPSRRKVVLATNIAETSLTIEGILLVVDSTLECTAQFDARRRVTRLLTQNASARPQ